MELLRLLNDAYVYFLDHRSEFGENLLTHLWLSGAALTVALVLCVPLGIFVARRQRIAPVVINIVGTLRVIPSLAVLFLALPYLGLGTTPALVALSILACPPVLLNTYAGFRGVDRAVIEAAQGLGMTPRQVLRQIEWPLALPVVIAGVRTAAVEVIASATLAAYIAAGGLGDYILRGFNTGSTAVLLLGAVPVALLALGAEALLGRAQRWASPTS
jgi:osmoprotectant transport system permease protein